GQDVERPGVAHHVVEDEDEGVLGGGGAEGQAAQEGAVGEVEGAGGGGGGEAGGPAPGGRGRGGGRSDGGAGGGPGGAGARHPAGGSQVEPRAQDVVAADDLAQGAVERREVERPVEVHRQGDVVGGARGLELVEKPETLLGEGERPRCAVRRLRHERSGG